MQLIKKINLSEQIGANSHYDKGGALVIENVTVFTHGDFVGEGGAVVNIHAEIIAETDWVNLLQGRPLIEGHTDIQTSNYGELIRGTVKKVKVVGEEVVADIIIADKSLQDKVITGDLRSVSLSFVWNEELKKIEYINHLGVVKIGQVREAVIHLSNEKKAASMKDKEKIFNLEKQVEELTEQVNDFKKKEATLNQEEKQLAMVQIALEQNNKEWEGKYDIATQCIRLGLNVNLDDTSSMTKALLSHKEEIVKKHLSNAEGDIDTLFSVALSLQEKEKIQAENINKIKVDAGNMSFHEIMQAKALNNKGV